MSVHSETRDRVAVTGAGLALAGAAGDSPLASRAIRVHPDEDDLAARVVRVDRKRIKLMSADVLASHVAVQEALADAGLRSADGGDPLRLGIRVGTRMSSRMHARLADAVAESGDGDRVDPNAYYRALCRRVNPLDALKYLSNRVALHLAITHGVKGSVRTFGGSACASGHALLDAWDDLRCGALDRAIAGGVDLGLDPLGRFLEWFAGASDEGTACFLVLERESLARARGARIHGFLLGGACPGVRGDTATERAREGALRSARLTRASVAQHLGAAPVPVGNGRVPCSVADAMAAAAVHPDGRIATCAVADRDLAAAAFVVEAA